MQKNSLKSIRKEKGMTLKEVADIAGVSAGYICHLEKGSRKNPSREVMEKVAHALNRSISEIFF